MRVAIFVDGANLFYCQRDVLTWWIDWGRFIEYFWKSGRVVIARYYRALRGPIANADEAAFGQALTSSGYVICEKPLKEVFDKYTGQYVRKGNLDVELALDALDSADSYDHCLLVSGDGDFVALVDRLRTKGKLVTAASTRGSVAYELRMAVEGSFFDLRRYRSKFERRASRMSNQMVPATDRGTPSLRRRRKPNIQTPPGTVPVQNNLTLDSRYKVGDQFAATVKLINDDGALVIDEVQTPAFLPTSNLRLPVPFADVSALVRVGDEYVVRVVELRPGRTRAVLMVELADSNSIATLQARLDGTNPTVSG